jgi:hypothetical protein
LGQQKVYQENYNAWVDRAMDNAKPKTILARKHSDREPLKSTYSKTLYSPKPMSSKFQMRQM